MKDKNAIYTLLPTVLTSYEKRR